MHIHGNKDDGYTANEGTATCLVSKWARKRWRATIAGRPTRNPTVRGSDGSVSRSCMCPTLVVGTKFNSRREAAEAGCAAYRKEWNNV